MYQEEQFSPEEEQVPEEETVESAPTQGAVPPGEAPPEETPPDASRQTVIRNPAHRSFRPGESFEYMTVIYNAKTKKKNPPDLESQIVLYKDGIEHYKSEAEAINFSGVNDFKRIPIRKKLQLADTMQPGDYILQFVVKDKNAKEKESLAAQTLSFKVAEPEWQWHAIDP